MKFLVPLDTEMNSRNNKNSCFFETLSSFQQISFTLFAYQYFKISWGTKLLIERIQKDVIDARLRTVKIITICLIVALFVTKLI